MRPRDSILFVAVSALGALSIACAGRAPSGAPPVSQVVATFSPIERAVLGAAIDSIAAGWKDSTALCLRVLGGPAGWELPPRDLLEALHTRHQPLSVAACPRTYASMVLRTDSLGHPILAPPGYVDPYILTVGRPQFESDSYGWVHARELQGTAGRDYLCTIQYVRGRAWANCATLTRWVY